MKDQGKMPSNRLQLLVHDLLLSVPDLIFEKTIELLPDNCRAVAFKGIDIRQCLDVIIIEDTQYPVIFCIDPVQVPFGSADGSSTLATTVRERH